MTEKTITMAYTIREGDGLTGLTERYGITKQDLISVNPQGISFTPGDEVRIPVRWRICPHGLLYPLKRGDTLSAVAARFGMTLFELLSINPCLAPWDCTPGLVIIIHHKGAQESG